MFQFGMIVDDIFCRLNKGMMVNDSFSVSNFAKNGPKTEMANGKMTKGAFKIS